MKKILLFLFMIFTVCIFIGCSPMIALIGSLEPTADMSTQRYMLELLARPDKELLNNYEKEKASKAICQLKHLEEHRNSKSYINKSKKFCELKDEDKLYFYFNCFKCAGSIDNGTSYLVVRDGKPIVYSSIDRKWSKKLNKIVYIIERLH